MWRRSPRVRKLVPTAEVCEDRALATLVFVLNGDALGAVGPSDLTANAARVLQLAGHRAVQLSTPTIDTPAAFYRVASQMRAISRGQPFGIVGFSAGGTLAARLAGVANLNVKAALDYYGPPDLRTYLDLHRGDRFYRYVVGKAHFTPATINLLSGPARTSAYVVGAFGLLDNNVVAPVSAASLRKAFPRARVYYYPGPHGVSINASPPALADFLVHL